MVIISWMAVAAFSPAIALVVASIEEKCKQYIYLAAK
jgi:hypothetical protein